jgi:hypothetical protein
MDETAFGADHLGLLAKMTPHIGGADEGMSRFGQLRPILDMPDDANDWYESVTLLTQDRPPAGTLPQTVHSKPDTVCKPWRTTHRVRRTIVL